MKNIYKNLSEKILKKAPFHWIIGWHKFLPIIIGLALLGLSIGLLSPTRIYDYYSDDSLEFSGVFLGFVASLAFILYIIRQLRFNSFRVHHHLPFAKSIMVFFSFWFIALLFSLIPFVPYQSYVCKIRHEINTVTNDFKKDRQILKEGAPFFESELISNEDRVLIQHYNEQVDYEYVYDKKNHEKRKKIIPNTDNINLKITVQPFKDKLDIVFGKDSVLIKRYRLDFGYYRYTNETQRLLSNNEAIARIERFIKVAAKYNIALKEHDASTIFEQRKNFNNDIATNKGSFSLFDLVDIGQDYYRTAGNSYSSMISHYNRYYDDNFEWEIILAFLIFSVVIATLLWIFIAVPVADFGFSILAAILLSIFSGIGIVLVLSTTSHNEDESIRVFLYLVILIIFLIAFVGNKQTRLQRIFKIVSHYSIPILLVLFAIELIESDHFSSDKEFLIISTTFIIGIVISIFIYKRVYKNYMLLPK